MAVLQSTNVQGTLCVNGVAIGGGKDIKFCCFTGSDNWTPSQDLVDGGGYVESTLVAGGGGGGGAGVQGFPTATYGTGGGGGGGEVNSFVNIIDSTDACCHVVGDGGRPGGVACFGAQVASIRYTSSQAGGNSTFLGNTAFGGGGGRTAVYRCNRFNCSLGNNIGGPIGGSSLGGTFNTCVSGCFSGVGIGYGGGSTAGNINTQNNHPYRLNISWNQGYQCIVERGTGLLGCFVSSSHSCFSGSGNDCVGRSNITRGFTGPGTYIQGVGTAGEGGGIIASSGGTTGIKGELCRTTAKGAKVFGGGGAAASICCITNPSFLCCEGTSGSAGIVILKWEE